MDVVPLWQPVPQELASWRHDVKFSERVENAARVDGIAAHPAYCQVLGYSLGKLTFARGAESAGTDNQLAVVFMLSP